MAPTKKTAKAAKTSATAKKTVKKAAKKTGTKAVKTSAKKTVKKPVKKAAKSVNKAAVKSPAFKPNPGTIAHTEFASSDPAATKAWAMKSLGWAFAPAMPMPDGDYHMWTMGKDESGGIRNTMGPENPGTVVYVEVENVKRAYTKALKNGATSMVPPMVIGHEMGSMAVVNAPGGVAVGLWAPK